MTIPMPTMERIRAMDARGTSARQIAKELGVSRNTVAKYVAQEDFSPKPMAHSPRSIVDEYAHIITGWLIDDLRQPKKQRHTGRRVYDRLVAEHGFTGSYSTVQRWVKRWRQSRRQPGEGFNELWWEPGIAQADFGEADVYIQGVRTRVHVLVMTFPYSNARYAAALPGETSECVCEGLRRIFEHVGLAPHAIVFDNATGVGKRDWARRVTTTRLFELFKLHYRVQARFTSPGSGNEKGSVENAVGYIRRNFLVPLPHVESLPALTPVLLEAGDGLLATTHYRKRDTIGAWFQDDKQAMLPLPGIGFDACTWLSRRVDLVGNVQIDEVKYHAGNEYAGQQVQVGLRAFTVLITTLTGTVIAEHPRTYGATSSTVHDPAQFLPGLTRKPGAMRNSPLRQHLPPELLHVFDQADPHETRRLLRLLQHVSGQAGFHATVKVMAKIAADGRTINQAEVEMGATRTTESAQPGAGSVDLGVYDRLTERASA